jgi:hypothetical protein
LRCNTLAGLVSPSQATEYQAGYTALRVLLGGYNDRVAVRP